MALSGESADEVFGGYRDFHDADTVAADTFPWLAGRMMNQRHDPAVAVRPGPGQAARPRRLPRRRSTGTALAEVPALTGPAAEDPHERRMREICYLYLTRFLPNLLDRKDRMSMAVGLEVRVPFCDHRLVEYVFGTPWAHKTFDGREKSLLRAATADLLPESVVQRVKSPYPSTQDVHYEEMLRAEVARARRGPGRRRRPAAGRRRRPRAPRRADRHHRHGRAHAVGADRHAAELADRLRGVGAALTPDGMRAVRRR